MAPPSRRTPRDRRASPVAGGRPDTTPPYGGGTPSDALRATRLFGLVDRERVPGHAVPGDAVPRDAVPGDAIPGDAVPGDAVPRHAVPVVVVPGDAVPGHAVPRQRRPRDPAKRRVLPLQRAAIEHLEERASEGVRGPEPAIRDGKTFRRRGTAGSDRARQDPARRRRTGRPTRLVHGTE